MTTRDLMIRLAASQPTPALCEALELLDSQPAPRTEEERISRAVIIDVLCERHPEADAAFDAWAADEASQPSPVPVITAAARAALVA